MPAFLTFNSVAASTPDQRPPWLQLLDEPINNLNMDTIELLETALAEYDGRCWW